MKCLQLSRHYVVWLEPGLAEPSCDICCICGGGHIALGLLDSLAANSWMHTPAGHEIRDGIAYPFDWFAIVFNPSFPYRFAHMFTAAYLTTSLVVLALGARYLLAGRFPEEARTMMRMGLGMV